METRRAILLEKPGTFCTIVETFISNSPYTPGVWHEVEFDDGFRCLVADKSLYEVRP